MAVFFVLALAVVANDGRVFGRRVLRSGFSPAEFPVEAVRAARAENVEGPLFNHFVWGGYVAFEWPAQRVFVTGLKYDADVVASYVRLASVFPGWERELEQWAIAQVLVPTESPLVMALNELQDWCVFHADSTATLIVRRSTLRTVPTPCRAPTPL
jgi:hypothetical protein